MAEPKYYDELPTYIMHSDGEFADGTFRAIDGSGNKLDIRFSEYADIGAEYLYIESNEHKARFIASFTDNSNDSRTMKSAMFNIVIDDVDYTVQPSYVRVGTLILDSVNISVRDTHTTPANVLSMKLTSKDYIDAQDNKIKDSIPVNIKDGTGTGSVIGGIVSGENACVASGEASVAIGSGAHANGEAAFACNNGKAVGNESFAAGDHTTANGCSQTVIGKYNVEQGSADAIQQTDNAFIIGNGTGHNARSNAFAVRWDGAIVLANGTVLTVEQLAKVANLT